MKSNLMSWLLSTGLDDKRAALYLAALSAGEATARELSDGLKIGRTAVYDNLRILEEQGYMRTVRHGKRKVFVPTHPKELYKKFESQNEQLKDLLPDFLALYAAKDTKPFVQLFDGPFAAREVYEDILRVAKKEYVYFSPPHFASEAVDQAYMKKWIGRRARKEIHSRSLRVAEERPAPIDPVFTDEARCMRQIRYLPSYVQLRSSVYIYENNVGIISTRKEGSACIIYSPDLAFSLKQLFEFLWNISVR